MNYRLRIPVTQEALRLLGTNRPSSNCLYSILLVCSLGGPGGGVASSMVACIMPITLAITTKEMKIPFQSLDFVGIETNSCIIKIDC